MTTPAPAPAPAPHPTRRAAPSLRLRAAAVSVAALLLGTVLLGGAGSGTPSGGPARTGTSSSGPEWTDASWTVAKSADGPFTALTLAGVQNYRCTAGFWSSATVAWQRPAGAPSGATSYRVTRQRAGTSQTTTQTGTTFEYSRPAFNFDNVTITVQPVVGQWTGPSRSMKLDAVVAVGMRCPAGSG